MNRRTMMVKNNNGYKAYFYVSFVGLGNIENAIELMNKYFTTQSNTPLSTSGKDYSNNTGVKTGSTTQTRVAQQYRDYKHYKMSATFYSVLSNNGAQIGASLKNGSGLSAKIYKDGTYIKCTNNVNASSTSITFKQLVSNNMPVKISLEVFEDCFIASFNEEEYLTTGRKSEWGFAEPTFQTDNHNYISDFEFIAYE